MGSQVDFCHIDQPPVRKVKLCTEEVKIALVEVSVRAQTSLEKARKAAQAFSKYFYGHNNYHSYKEKYPEEAPKIPKTAEDYANYAIMLTFFQIKKRLQNTSMNQALVRERDAAKALMNKKSNEKVILHFDSTTRSRIDGDWPSLILNMRSPPNVSNKFTLWPLFFAFEDRQNISKLIVHS